MLVVNFYTLQTVYTLHFTKHIILYGTDTLDLHNIVRVYTTFCQFITGFQNIAIQNFDSGTIRNQVRLTHSSLIVCNNNFAFFLCISNLHSSAKLGNNSKSLWLSCLEKLFDTRKTLCDIIAGHTTGMECTHGKLCTRFSDRLCSNNTNCFSYLYRLFCCHVRSITFCTNTNVGTTGKNRTDLNLCFISCINNCFCIDDTGCSFRCDHMICLYDDLTVIVQNRLTGIAACNTLFQRLDYFFSI